MGVAGEVDAGLVVQDVGDGDREGVVGAVQHVLLLGELTGVVVAHGYLVSGSQALDLIAGQHQLVIRLAGHFQAEQLLNILHGVLEGGVVLLVLGHVLLVELGVGDGLAGQVAEIGVVVGSGIADGQSAGLVVAGHQDQGVSGMLLGEVHGHLNGVRQSQGVGHGGAGVVGVAGPVDLAALAHHEEALVIVQDLDALFHIVRQGPFALLAVQLVAHGVGVCQVLVDEDDLLVLGGDLGRIGLGVGDLVAGRLRQIIEVLLVSAAAVGILQGAAGKILKAGLHHLHADLIVVVAAGLMGIEGGGGGVVQVHGGDDAHLPALLGVELFGDGLIGHGAGLVGVDHAGVCLVAGGDGGGGGSGVGSEAAGVVGDGGAGHIEVHEVQGHRTVQLGALPVLDTGLSLHVILVRHGAQVIGSGLELGIAHAVADKQEHILGGFGGVVHGGTRQFSADHSGHFFRLSSGLPRSGGAAGSQAQNGRTGQQTCKKSFHHVDFLSFLNIDFLGVMLSIWQPCLIPPPGFCKGSVKAQHTEERRPDIPDGVLSSRKRVE